MHPSQPTEREPGESEAGFTEDDLNAPAADPLVGRVIQDRFRIDKKLGQGGMGAIYLAEHLLLKKQVAIKCLHAGLASNPDVIRRFKNEAVAASSIGHPNIVDVMDMGRFEDGTFFMVLEYLDGRDWQDDLDRLGREPASKVAHVGVQVCAALGAAAAKGIVHRDLKPENIFLIERLGDANFVKVLDFGISKIHDGSGGATKTGELMGTPYYMAPEQVLGEKEITHLADIYALGVIFFQALSGTVPFEGNTLAQVLLKIASQPSPSLSERGSGLPEDLARLVNQMIEKSPAARPQSFQEIAIRLAPFLGNPSILSPGGADMSASVSSPTSNQSPQAFFKTQFTGTISARTLEPGSGSAPHTFASPALSANTRRPLAWILGAGAALVLALGTWFASQTGNGESDQESVALSPKEASVDEKSKPLEEVSKEENEHTVRVQITTVPVDAELSLDGKPLSNPFDADLKKDEKSHELVVKREGFQTETRQMVLTDPQRIVIPLTAENKRPDRADKPGPKASAKPAPAPQPASGSSSQSTPKPIRDLERGLKKLF